MGSRHGYCNLIGRPLEHSLGRQMFLELDMLTSLSKLVKWYSTDIYSDDLLVCVPLVF